MTDTNASDGRHTPGSRQRVSAAAPGDVLRVEMIRAALERNEYVIDPRRIADRILQFERDFPR